MFVAIGIRLIFDIIYHPALTVFVTLYISRKLYKKVVIIYFLKCQHQIKRKWKKAAETTQVLVENNVQDILLSENSRLLNCAFNMFPLVYKRVCVPVSVYIYIHICIWIDLVWKIQIKLNSGCHWAQEYRNGRAWAEREISFLLHTLWTFSSCICIIPTIKILFICINQHELEFSLSPLHCDIWQNKSFCAYLWMMMSLRICH